MSTMAITYTIEEMIENRMIWFKKNGTIDKRCSAYRQKIVDENCKIILPIAVEVCDDDTMSCYSVDDDTKSCYSIDENVDDEQQKVDDITDSLSALMISETVEEIDEKKMNVLTGWLLDIQNRVCNHHKNNGYLITPDQSREILEMTFGMMRRFFESNKIETDKLQLVAIVAWRISNKLLDDDFYMSNEQCIYACADAYTDDDVWDLEFKLMNYISYDVCRDGIDEVEFLVKNQGGIEKAQTSENDIVKMVCVC